MYKVLKRMTLNHLHSCFAIIPVVSYSVFFANLTTSKLIYYFNKVLSNEMYIVLLSQFLLI